MTQEHADPLVTTEWLAGYLDDPAIRVVDASYFVPGGIEPAKQQYDEGHIPGAVFFDINDIADPNGTKDHAFPTADIFAAKVGSLGIGNNHHVVAYDHVGGVCAAARVWFMFRAFGHGKVSVLDGGRTKWTREGHPMSTEVPEPSAALFKAVAPTAFLKSKKEILANIENPTFQVLDARTKGRFEGTEPEPREGLRSGHIPGSFNLPFADLLDGANKTWKDVPLIRNAFNAAGIDLAQPLVTSCGSGVTACALALGAHLAGKDDTAIYDGSWVDWGADDNVPIAAGPQSGS